MRPLAPCFRRPSRGALPDRPDRGPARGPPLPLGIVREVVRGDVIASGQWSSPERVAGLPRKAILETKRRTLLERRHLWGFLFEDEQRVFRRALMGHDSEEEPARNGAAA